MHVRSIRTRAVVSAIAVMSVAAVMRSAADAHSSSLPAAIASDPSTLEPATTRGSLFPSHPVALEAAQAGATAAVPPALLAEQVFKNVQALKGISASDFMGTMGIMSASRRSAARDVLVVPPKPRQTGGDTESRLRIWHAGLGTRRSGTGVGAWLEKAG